MSNFTSKVDGVQTNSLFFPYRKLSASNEFYQLSILEENPEGTRSFTVLVDVNPVPLDPIDALEPLRRAFSKWTVVEENVHESTFQIKVILDESSKPLYNTKYFLNSLLGRLTTAYEYLYNSFMRHNNK